MNTNRLRLAVAALNGKPVSVRAFFTGTELADFIADPGTEADEVLVFVQPQLSYKEQVKPKIKADPKAKA